MTRNRMLFLSRAAVAALMLCAVLGAQSQLSSLSGRATDGSGALIPQIQMRLTNQGTGESWQAVTSGDGGYLFLLVKPGVYELTAEAPGFKRYVRTGIVLETAVQARLDFALELGSVQESVTVEASVPLLQSESSAVGLVIENRTIANMPLINRRALQLVKLTGFITPIGNDQGRAAAGGRGAENMFSVDGGLIQNVSVDTPEPFFDPPIESLQEFNVSVSNYAAELGRTGGAVVQVTTKSGTNAFHGSGYGFIRNDAFDARTFFAAGKEKLRYGLYGGSIGGPVRRDKTHFFFNYEGLRNKREFTRIVNVPTRAETRGDLRAFGRTVRDPAANAPFPNNIIPASRLDPVGSQLALLFPEPNIDGRPTRNNNYRAPQTQDQPSNNYVGRVDHVFGVKDRIYGRILASDSKNNRGPIFPTPGIDSFHQLLDTTYQNLSGTWFRNFSPTWINEFRLSWVRRVAPQWHGGRDSGLAERIGLRGTNARYVPRLEVEGLTQFGNGNRQDRAQDPIRSTVFTNNQTLIRGKHTIKYGGDYRKNSNTDYFFGTAGGRFSFNSVPTNDGLGALLLGWTREGFRQEALPLRTRADYTGLFAQDDWRVSRGLTLNLGLRWDYDQPRWETLGNRQNSFDRSAINPVSGTPGVVTFSGRNGLGKFAHNHDLNNFGPRAGFAWKIGDNWVVRGGGAVTYVAAYNNNVAFDPSLGFGVLGSFVSPDNGLTPAFLLKDGLPALRVPGEQELNASFGAVRVGQPPSTSVLFLEPGDRRNGYLQTFNFNIQRQLRFNMLVELGYIGTLGHKLAGPTNQSINQVRPELMGPGNAQIRRPFPQFSDVQVMMAAVGNSTYHGMNLKVDKRASGGLHFQANYTWSRFIDDMEARAELGGSPGSGFANFYDRRADRGLSGNHLSHRFIWSSVYELPIGGGRRFAPGGRVLNGVAGGWSLGYILEMRTGAPYGMVEQTNRTNAFAEAQRPNVVGVARIEGGRSRDGKINGWFNPAAFAQPREFTFGNAGRTSGFGPGAISMDLSILKDFPVVEGQRLQFRAEMLNVENRPAFGLPATGRGAPNIAQIRSLAPGNASRVMQLGLHYKF